jgi:hypothetical protein
MRGIFEVFGQTKVKKAAKLETHDELIYPEISKSIKTNEKLNSS